MIDEDNQGEEQERNENEGQRRFWNGKCLHMFFINSLSSCKGKVCAQAYPSEPRPLFGGTHIGGLPM